LPRYARNDNAAGDSLFSGYSGNEQKTAAAMAEGWFNTGVSAEIDAKGQLVISKK
jgi:long-subunit acyl-CoA synthetase (AMP-forming)